MLETQSRALKTRILT